MALAAALLTACSTTDKPYVEKPLNDLYSKALHEMKEQDYLDAADSFDEVERQYPYSSWAAKAQLMSAYCAFKAQKFERAIATLDIFITLHPSSPSIAYAYYLRALCYYTNILPVFRDRENADLGLQAFEEVIRRFPNTDYAEDARFKSDFLREHLASQEILVGRQYLQSKSYVAALKQFSDLIEHYPRSILLPEALYRIIECQIALGFGKQAHKTLRVLQHNFPKDAWYTRGRALIKRYGC